MKSSALWVLVMNDCLTTSPPLDLIDGDDFVQMLKTYKLGVTVTEKTIQEIAVNESWFESY